MRWRGTAVVELAIVITLLFLLTLGTIHYGWLLLKDQDITNAARQGARVGARVDGTIVDVQAAIENIMDRANLPGVYHWEANPADVGDLLAGDVFYVRVWVNKADVAIMSTSLFPTPNELSAKVYMAKEGPEFASP